MTAGDGAALREHSCGGLGASAEGSLLSPVKTICQFILIEEMALKFTFLKLQLGNLVHIEIRNNMNKNTNTPEKNRFPHSKSSSFHSEQG